MRLSILLFLFVALAIPHATAQPQSLRPAQLDELFTDEPRIEVNVTGALLRMVAEMAGEDEPEFANMLRSLRGVYVRQYALSAARPGVEGRVAGFARSLESAGWEAVVRVREPAQDVSILWRPVGNGFDGLVVMVLNQDDDEATFVTIDGRIDPAQIGRLGRQFNVPELGRAAAANE